MDVSSNIPDGGASAIASIFLACQVAAHAEECPAFKKMIQQDDLFREPDGAVPWENDDTLVAQELRVVGTKRIVLEMMLDGPQRVEAEFFRENSPRQIHSS